MKLDLGCGKNKLPGFIGVDQYTMEGVDVVANLSGPHPWPWEDNSVDEVHSSHFVEHLDAKQRVHFVNELHRVLKPGGVAKIVVPHWSSHRAYGDPTHQWPPVSEMWFYYLLKSWRDVNAPHTDSQWNPEGFNCDFDATWGYAIRQDIQARNFEYQQYAVSNYKDVVQDIIATLKKRG